MAVRRRGTEIHGRAQNRRITGQPDGASGVPSTRYCMENCRFNIHSNVHQAETDLMSPILLPVDLIQD